LREIYQKQTDLVLSILPLIQHEDFALKGGTAINFFYREIPRLSVDIDLTYLPLRNRQTSFDEIHTYLGWIQKVLRSNGIECTSDHPLDGKRECKLVASADGSRVKIEPNFILRGAVEPAEKRQLSSHSGRAGFGSGINCLSFHDVYGGKLCAALSRKHPRDLFDVDVLLANEGMSSRLKDIFLFYLISSPKPFIELLDPNWMPIDKVFRQHFLGMSGRNISANSLEKAFFNLKDSLRSVVKGDDIRFLISLLNLENNWDLSPLGNLEKYPAIKWRLFNLKKMDKFKREVEIAKLERWI